MNKDKNENGNENEAVSLEDFALQKFWQEYQAEKGVPRPDEMEVSLTDGERKRIKFVIADELLKKKEVKPVVEADEFGSFDLGEKEEVIDEELVEKVPEVSGFRFACYS
jgi:hypothetical protein